MEKDYIRGITALKTAKRIGITIWGITAQIYHDITKNKSDVKTFTEINVGVKY
jgi:hypothetical protein